MVNPASVKIFGKVYTIEENNEIADDGDYGQCNHRKQQIFYCSGQHHDQVRDTILHEIIHAIDHGINFGLKEEQVHGLACAIYCMFKDNPELLNWMFKGGD